MYCCDIRPAIIKELKIFSSMSISSFSLRKIPSFPILDKFSIDESISTVVESTKASESYSDSKKLNLVLSTFVLLHYGFVPFILEISPVCQAKLIIYYHIT